MLVMEGVLLWEMSRTRCENIVMTWPVLVVLFATLIRPLWMATEVLADVLTCSSSELVGFTSSARLSELGTAR